MAKKVKCRYKHCLHEDKYLNKNDAVMGGNKYYYHPDCYEEMQIIEDIINCCMGLVINYNSKKMITEMIDKIIFDNHVPAKELLEKVKIYIQLGKTINYPQGLKYIVKDDDTEKEYRIRMNRKKIMSDTGKPVLIEDTKFNYVCPKRKTILDILV